MALTRRAFHASVAAAMAAPALMRRAGAQGATLKIGMCTPVTGPAAESGRYAQIGAHLAADAVNKAGGALGKQIELIVEDDQTTNPGVVLAFSKLAAQDDIVAFLGSIRSTQVHAMAPDVLKLGKPVMIGGTDPNLTHMGNPWLFRFRPNDSYSGRVLADFGCNTVGKKNWAIVHSTDAFGTAGGKALAEALAKIDGAKIALDQGYANQSQDFTPVVLAIKQSGADILGSYFTFENDLGIFARQLRQLGVTIPYVGSPSITNVTARKLAGAALYDTYGVADFVEDSSEAAKAFGKAYREIANVAPDNLSAWTYDAMTVLCMAINKAGKTEPAAIREAILSVRNFPGAEGAYNFDANGDGLHGYNIVRNDKGNIVFEKHVDFND
ncbi:MAG TPA: ABC transporter substrate-binding protein [Roseiarcus sp.]|nr:ABC transporter substrate-binding protein [Roseiarcus sp.]